MVLSSGSEPECGGEHGNLVGGIGMDDKQALECAKGLKSYCEEYAENDCLGCIFLLNNLGCQDVEKARVFFQDSGKYPFEWTLDKPWRG
jgi:hypothetical protein